MFKVADIASAGSFRMTGKMSFSDGQEGGSGQVEWQQNGDALTLILKAPLSKRSWTLTESTQGAKLVSSRGDEVYADSASRLISNEVGWPVPWDALKLWLVGKMTEEGQSYIEPEKQTVMTQDLGWEIKYSNMKEYNSEYLPHKIIARKGDYSIKLSVKVWQW